MAVAAFSAAPRAVAATGTCGGKKASIRTDSVFKGGPGKDVLIGSGRSQTILGGGGNDLICAGGGNDTVHGQGGADTIHGDGRGDSVFGDGGPDRLYGDILDDRLSGGAGADLLIGGHGVDRMFGGAGNDLLRGGTNRDCLYGQGGTNTASFGTATPPGAGIDGVSVNLALPTKAGGECPAAGSGRADGDGGPEVLSGISFVVGSAFADAISGAPGAKVDAGLGADSCPAFDAGATAGCGPGDEAPAGTVAQVFEPATGAPTDPGVIVRAADGIANQTINLTAASGGVNVSTSDPLTALAGCTAGGTCTPATAPLGYVLAWGADGSDAITIGEGLPPNASIDADGGPGNDTLTGSSLGEVLFGGDGAGADVLQAKAGGDALISEGGTPDSGPDLLAAGKGDDQLVADYPCAGHTLIGGPGDDVAGFARSSVGIRAKIGGAVTFPGGACPGGKAGAVRVDNEVLEGTRQADRLIGSARRDILWGRGGNDVLTGLGNADTLLGFAGRDLLLAKDGTRDLLLRCGEGKDRGARRDRIDPPALSC